MNGLLREVLALLPRPVAEQLHSLKHRLYWLTKGRRLHRHYFDTYQTRSKVIDVVNDCLDREDRSTFHILELGCSSANNLRLLRETVSKSIRFVGFDVQSDAIAYAKNNFSDDLFIVGDDRKLLEKASSLGRFDVFLASAVLYYVPERRCRATLSMAAKIADYVIICDNLSQFDSPKGICNGLFLHPYRRLCQDVGLHIVKEPIPLNLGIQHSIFVASPFAGKRIK